MKHNFVRAIIQNLKGEYFMVFNITCRGGAGEWNFPGGKAEPGETPEAAVERETREEINLNLIGLSLVFETELVWPGYRDNTPQHGYYYKADANMLTLRFNEPHKIPKAEFMSRDKILGLPISASVRAFFNRTK